jgi:hypothetical protein
MLQEGTVQRRILGLQMMIGIVAFF